MERLEALFFALPDVEAEQLNAILGAVQYNAQTYGRSDMLVDDFLNELRDDLDAWSAENHDSESEA